MPEQIRPDDPNLTWQGAISFHHADGWTMPWRMPYGDLVLFPPDGLREQAAMPAGVRLCFRSDTQTITGYVDPGQERLVPPESRHAGLERTAVIDLYCDGRFRGSAELMGRESFLFEALPPGEKLIELWLPHFGQFRLRSIELTPGAAIAPYEDPRPRWVTYGSSLTHSAQAERPSETWPAIVAREQGLNLTSLGYGGQCHLDIMFARMIRDLPADFLSMEVGINIYGGASFNDRTFGPAIIGFVQIVREKHPDTPFAIVSPFFSASRESTVNCDFPRTPGFTLPTMREEVSKAVQALKDHGDRNIHYFDGLDLFGPEYADMIPDGLHPDPQGYKVLAQNFSRKVAQTIFVPSKPVAAR